MADKKYKAGSIGVTAEQMATIEAAMNLFCEQHGVKLTLTWLAFDYVLRNKKGNAA